MPGTPHCQGSRTDYISDKQRVWYTGIANPKRVFTYELITDLVWKEDCDFYSRKAIHNHISKLRKKLRFEPDLPDYIESVAGIGYKFEQSSTP